MVNCVCNEEWLKCDEGCCEPNDPINWSRHQEKAELALEAFIGWTQQEVTPHDDFVVWAEELVSHLMDQPIPVLNLKALESPYIESIRVLTRLFGDSWLEDFKADLEVAGVSPRTLSKISKAL